MGAKCVIASRSSQLSEWENICVCTNSCILISPSLPLTFFICIYVSNLLHADISNSFVVVQSLNHVWLFGTSWTAACQTSLPFTISRTLLKLMPIVSVMPSNHLILCGPLYLLPIIFPASGSNPCHMIHSAFCSFIHPFGNL